MFNEIYWATRLVSIHNVCDVLSVISIIAFIIFGWMYSKWRVYQLLEADEARTCCKISVLVFCISTVGFVIFPSAKDMALIYGWEALTSETAKDVYRIIMEKIGV